MNIFHDLNSVYLIVIMICTIITALFSKKDDDRKTRKEKAMLPEITRVERIKDEIHCHIINHLENPITLYNVYLAFRYIPFFKKKVAWSYTSWQSINTPEYQSINVSLVITETSTIIIKYHQRTKNTMKILLETSAGISATTFTFPM